MGDVIDAAVRAGYTIRAPRLADAEAIWRFVSACNAAIIGFADCRLDDIRDELNDPGWDGKHDGWLAFDRSDRLVGYGWTYARGVSDQVNVEVITADDTTADWLLELSCERAREMGRERGHAVVTLAKRIYREDGAMRSRFEARADSPRRRPSNGCASTMSGRWRIQSHRQGSRSAKPRTMPPAAQRTK